MMKKRKVKKGRVALLLFIVLVVLALIIVLIASFFEKEEESPFSIDSLNINEVDYNNIEELDLDLYSNGYLLIRLNDFKALYGKNYDERFYPASLTKILTMDSVLNICDDINETSYFTYAQREDLINDNASLAYIDAEKDYSIKDLLYALVLPSGADAAQALDNYAYLKTNGSLVDEMNKICDDLHLYDSHFTNTTGLHDKELYTSLRDYSKIVIDVLNKPIGKEVLKSMKYQLADGTIVGSSLTFLSNRDDVNTLGGKTGYTEEAGMNICVLYQVNNRSYLLILKNAEGSPYVQQKHIEDVNKIYNYLYKD